MICDGRSLVLVYICSVLKRELGIHLIIRTHAKYSLPLCCVVLILIISADYQLYSAVTQILTLSFYSQKILLGLQVSYIKNVSSTFFARGLSTFLKSLSPT